MIDYQITIQTFSNLSQTVSTVMGIYIAVFSLVFGFLFNKHDYQKKTNSNKLFINSFLIFIAVLLAVLNYLFVFPSFELGLLTYLPILLILISVVYLVYSFNKNNEYKILEKGTILLSGIFALFSFILGFYIIISCISSTLYASSLLDSYVYTLVKASRMFLVTTLDSLVYLISFILIHKIFIIEN